MRRRFFSSDSKIAFNIDNYLTIEALEDGLTIAYTGDCEYGIDGVGWTKKSGVYLPSINAGQTISFRSETETGQFEISKRCNIKGNCMSLLFGDNAADNFSLEGKRIAFFNLFRSCPIVGVSDNFLPATTLASNCYEGMFNGCTSLTTAPELPATTLADECYNGMFSGCTNLTTAPELPATTLTDGCYRYMFYGCTNLNYIKMLATDISATQCLYNWVSGVASSGTFVKHSDMEDLPTGVNGIPSGWTVVNDGEESGGGNLITFTIDGTEYQAEEGMTWGEWVSSSYNTSDYTLEGNYIWMGGLAVGLNGIYVTTSDLIIADTNYADMPYGGGSN